MLAAAAGSGTGDWRRKVAFLERFAGLLSPRRSQGTEPGSDATAPGSGSGSGSGPGSGSTSQTTSGEEEDEGEGEADEVESPEELFTDLFQDAAAPLSPAEAPHSAMASIQAVRRCGDWRQRLDWLAGRGYRLSAVAASAAADAGNAEALE